MINNMEQDLQKKKTDGRGYDQRYNGKFFIE